MRLRIKKSICAWILCFVLCSQCMTVWAETDLDGFAAMPPPTVFAQAAVMIDGDTGRTLYGKNEDQVLPMASTTKIMTCIVALENADLNEFVTVSEYAASMPDVQLNIRPDECYQLKDLLYSLMLESHNDSAVAIAEHVAGSREAFAVMMNQKARDIGCRNTYFITPNGLDAIEENTGRIHGTTAKELAMIMRYCTQISPRHELFLEITGAPSCSFSDRDRTRSFSCINRNALLTSMEGAISGKTGFTNGAGYCYVGTVRKGEKTFICAVLGSGWPPNRNYRWQDIRKLITYGEQEYRYYEIDMQPIELGEIEVRDGTKDTVALKMAFSQEDTELPRYFLMRGDEQINIKKTIRKQLQAPVQAGMPVGQVEYCLNRHVVISIPIVTEGTVEKWNVKFCLKTLLNRFLFCYNAG